MTPVGWLVAALAFGSVLFTGVAVLGLYRMPDLYTRAHATSKADTLGAVLGFTAAALVLGGEGIVKLVLLGGFLLLTAPTAAHIVVRSAHDEGRAPWTRGDAATAVDGGETGPDTDGGDEP